MKKVHLCCGDVYLKGYVNCDIDGYRWFPEEMEGRKRTTTVSGHERHETLRFTTNENPNETTIENYFKHPFIEDSSKRKRRDFFIDQQMSPLMHEWPWKDKYVDEIVMVSGFEHFEHIEEIPHILQEAHRVLRRGGVFKFDFPDIEKTMNDYYEAAPEFCMELIYCNHKNKYSVHNWGYTVKSIGKYLTADKWSLEFKDVVQHDYPMTGVWATKL